MGADVTAAWWTKAKDKETTGKEVTKCLETFEKNFGKAASKRTVPAWLALGPDLDELEKALNKTEAKAKGVPVTLKAISELRGAIKTKKAEIVREYDICHTRDQFAETLLEWEKPYKEFETYMDGSKAEVKSIAALFPQVKAAAEKGDTARIEKIISVIEKRRKLYAERAHEAWNAQDCVEGTVRAILEKKAGVYVPGQKQCEKLAKDFGTMQLKFEKTAALLEDGIEKLRMVEVAK